MKEFFPTIVTLSEDRAVRRQARLWPDERAVRVEGPAFHNLSWTAESKERKLLRLATARPAKEAGRKAQRGRSLRMTIQFS
jgi:hypothetical protein